MASRKDFEEVAERLKGIPLSDAARMLVVTELADYFEERNPRFDHARFIEAATPKTGELIIDTEWLVRVLIDYLRASAEDGDLPSLGSLIDVAGESLKASGWEPS